MTHTSVARQLNGDDIANLTALLTDAWGKSPLGPTAHLGWFTLPGGDKTSTSDTVAVFVNATSRNAFDGYGEVTIIKKSVTLKSVTRPSARSTDHAIERAFLDAAFSFNALRNAASIHHWVRQATADDDKVDTSFGFSIERNLFHMSRSLTDFDKQTIDSSFTTRAFRQGVDEAQWIAVNNAAFFDHREQGNWTLETLQEHEAQPWFCAEGLLVHEQDSQIVAFCWTKIDPVGSNAGEIYVVGVDPKFHGRGIGRAITLMAMDYLMDSGCSIVDLYVDSANTSALLMYERLGFSRIDSDRAYFASSATFHGAAI